MERRDVPSNFGENIGRKSLDGGLKTCCVRRPEAKEPFDTWDGRRWTARRLLHTRTMVWVDRTWAECHLEAGKQMWSLKFAIAILYDSIWSVPELIEIFSMLKMASGKAINTRRGIKWRGTWRACSFANSGWQPKASGANSCCPRVWRSARLQTVETRTFWLVSELQWYLGSTSQNTQRDSGSEYKSYGLRASW